MSQVLSVRTTSGADPLTLLEHCTGSRRQCANISWPTEPLQMSHLNGTPAFGYCLLECLPLIHLMEVQLITNSQKKNMQHQKYATMLCFGEALREVCWKGIGPSRERDLDVNPNQSLRFSPLVS